MSALQIVLKSRPTGALVPSEVFASKSVPLPSETDLQPGQLLLETLDLSLDPVSRVWMTEDNYMVHIPIGSPMHGIGLVRVLASRSSKAKKGDILTAWSGWVSHAIVDEDKVIDQFTFPKGTVLTDALGFLGYTGLTGYLAMLKLGKPPQAGETVVVSAAAGATGSVAAQLAKIHGARVVGIAGGEDKGKWLKEELGLDAVVDYKRDDFEERLVEAVPNGIDLYFDNVGGRTLELALEHLNMSGRVTIVGDLSGYNTEKPHGIKSLFPIATKSASIHGFNLYAHLKDGPAAAEHMAQLVREGKLKRTETIVKGGLEAAPQALVDLFAGRNKGKMLIEVKPLDG